MLVFSNSLLVLSCTLALFLRKLLLRLLLLEYRLLELCVGVYQRVFSFCYSKKPLDSLLQRFYLSFVFFVCLPVSLSFFKSLPKLILCSLQLAVLREVCRSIRDFTSIRACIPVLELLLLISRNVPKLSCCRPGRIFKRLKCILERNHSTNSSAYSRSIWTSCGADHSALSSSS